MLRRHIFIFTSRSIVFSLSLLLLGPVAFAQKANSKALQEKMRLKLIDDSIPLYRGVQVKLDLVGLIQKAASDYGQYEVGVRVNL